MLNEVHVRQLEERGLDPELAVRLGWTSSDRLGDCIAIPYIRRGEIANHKYRTLGREKRFSQDPAAIRCLWNFDVLADETLKDHPVIITEGEFQSRRMVASSTRYPTSMALCSMV